MRAFSRPTTFVATTGPRSRESVLGLLERDAESSAVQGGRRWV
jgi:hypothetical protein